MGSSFIHADAATILHHPKSRLVPVGVKVTFTCIGQDPFWWIGEKALETEEFVNTIAEEGYIIERHDLAHGITSLTLTFNMTLDKNGTRIYCSSADTNSDIAVVLSINGKLHQNTVHMANT